jgi:hypothetical protein
MICVNAKPETFASNKRRKDTDSDEEETNEDTKKLTDKLTEEIDEELKFRNSL